MAIEILFVVAGFNVDRGMELTLVNANINVQEFYMGLGSVPGKVDGRETVELFKECNTEVRTMWPKIGMCHG